MSLPRPRVQIIRVDDPERSFDDPALAALAAQGWTLASVQYAQVDGAGGNREPRLMLILWPPPSPRPRLDWTHFVAALSAAASAVATITIALGTLAIAYGLAR